MKTKQSGVTISNMALAIFVLMVVLITTVTQAKKHISNIVKKQELQVFVDDLMIASKVHFFNQVNINGSCFTFTPTPIQGSALITSALLDSKYTSQRFFDPNLSVVSYRSGTASGLVDTIDIVVPLNEPATQSYYNLPYFTFGDEDEVRFSTKIEYGKSESFLTNLNTSFCHG